MAGGAVGEGLADELTHQNQQRRLERVAVFFNFPSRTSGQTASADPVKKFFGYAAVGYGGTDNCYYSYSYLCIFHKG